MMIRILIQKWLSFERFNYCESLGCVVKSPKSFGQTKPQNKKGWIYRGLEDIDDEQTFFDVFGMNFEYGSNSEDI